MIYLLQLGLQELKEDDWKKLKEILDINDYLNLYHICHKYLHADSLPRIECPSTTIPTLIPDGFSIQDLELSMVIQILVKNKAATDLCSTFKVSNKI